MEYNNDHPSVKLRNIGYLTEDITKGIIKEIIDSAMESLYYPRRRQLGAYSKVELSIWKEDRNGSYSR